MYIETKFFLFACAFVLHVFQRFASTYQVINFDNFCYKRQWLKCLMDLIFFVSNWMKMWFVFLKLKTNFLNWSTIVKLIAVIVYNNQFHYSILYFERCQIYNIYHSITYLLSKPLFLFILLSFKYQVFY